MRYTLFLVCLFVYSSSSFAQLSTYNIADYARPDLERRTAAIGFDMDFRALHLETSEAAHSSHFYLDLDFRQSKFINTTHHQINASNYIQLAVRDNKENAWTEEKENKSSIVFSRTYNRKNFDEKQRFWELGYTARAGIHKESPIQQRFDGFLNNDMVYSFHQFFIDRNEVFLETNISRGTGRIELISDAWQAKTILETLKARDLVEGEISQATIQAFAEKISDIKNTRNTDFRLERMSELEALNEFVQGQNWAKIEDFRFFPTLLDTWDYEAFEARFSGKEFKYGLQPSVAFREGYNTYYHSDWKYIQYGLEANISYNTYKPVSDDWQINNQNTLSIAPTFFQRFHQSNTNEQINWISTLRTRWELQFLPSLRTHYSISASGLLTARDSVHPSFWNLSLSGRYVYYFSPKFNLRIAGGLYLYNHFDTGDKPGLAENLEVTTTYRFY